MKKANFYLNLMLLMTTMTLKLILTIFNRLMRSRKIR